MTADHIILAHRGLTPPCRPGSSSTRSASSPARRRSSLRISPKRLAVLGRRRGGLRVRVLLRRDRHPGDADRDAAAPGAGRGRRDRRRRSQREMKKQKIALHLNTKVEGMSDEPDGAVTLTLAGRHDGRRSTRCWSRPGGARTPTGLGPRSAQRRARRPRPDRGQRPAPDLGRRALRDRRRHRHQAARPLRLGAGQGGRRADRRAPGADQLARGSGRHLHHARDRERRPHRARGVGAKGARSRSGASRSAPTAATSPTARPRASSRLVADAEHRPGAGCAHHRRQGRAS
mgnify:CR=1 FL=1